MRAVAALAIIAVLVQFAAFITLLLRRCKESFQERRLVSLLLVLVSWVAYLCMFLVVVVFGAHADEGYGFSFALACVAAVLQFAQGVLVTMDHIGTCS